MSYALLAVLILLVLAFGFLMWKSRDLLRWYTVTASTLSLLLAIVLLLPTAATLKSRAAWHKVKEDLEAQLVRLRSDQESLKRGDPAVGVGVLELQEDLNRYSLEAGRRWHNLRAVAGASPTAITLEKVAPASEVPPGMEGEVAPPAATPAPAAGTPPAAGAAASAAPSPLVPVGLIVYGFAETVRPGLEVAIPTFYLGEFRVRSSTPTQVVLEPTGRLEAPQLQAITSGQASSWALYELLPLDDHDVFIAEGSEVTDDALFGRVDTDLLTQLMGQGLSPDTLAKYTRDGSRALPEDPPPSRWIKIEFTQTHKIAVDSPEQRGALDGGFFDGSGQAVDSRLQRGGEDGSVSFNVGEQLVLKEEAANELIDAGVAKLVDNYYVRPLNDYRMVLRRLRLRLETLGIRRQQLELEQKVLEDAIAATVKMLAANQEAKLKLEKDFAQIQVERNAISAYNGTVRQQLDETKATLTSLYRENLAMRQQLVEIEQGIEAAIPR
jgi:hypothetical protein